jgi:Zn/Cd-binding protein ZinT
VLNCIKNIKKKRKCDHEWRVHYVYLPDMRMKCLKCHAKKTVAFTAFDFLRYWVKPYLENPDNFKKYQKTIAFFEKNKKMILKSALEEIAQHLEKTEQRRQELNELKKLCKAAALL